MAVRVSRTNKYLNKLQRLILVIVILSDEIINSYFALSLQLGPPSFAALQFQPKKPQSFLPYCQPYVSGAKW